jgi:hypothetical protein
MIHEVKHSIAALLVDGNKLVNAKNALELSGLATAHELVNDDAKNDAFCTPGVRALF